MHHLFSCPRRESSISRAVNQCQALVRFFALRRIKPHNPLLVRAPVNSFEFQPCGRMIDKGLMKAPVNQFYKEGEYSAIIDDVIATWHKDDYLKAVESRKATEQNQTTPEPKQKKSKDREER